MHIREDSQWTEIDREELVNIQVEDPTLEKFRVMNELRSRGKYESRFEVQNGILYRVFKHPQLTRGGELRQVMVPEKLRRKVMKVAHDSILGGHLGIRKTTDKMLTSFYWPGIQSDVTRYCRSCDICQRTVHKGRVTKVSLEKMPLIDTPFKRCAVDLVGPIHPPSEEGHRYILMLVEYATL